MSKDSTEALTAGPNTRLLLADVGSTEPADIDTDFGGAWTDVGYLIDPPAFSRDQSSNDAEVWNAEDPIRTLSESDIHSVELKLAQTNPLTLELFFGPITITDEGSGVTIEPNDDVVAAEYAMCLELVDGSRKIRHYWRRTTVSTTGDWSMDKAQLISYDITLKRLAPTDGSKSWRKQTNVSSLVSA